MNAHSPSTMKPFGPIETCNPADRRRNLDAYTLNAKLFALQQIGRDRALTDTESRELERLLRIKDQRDLRRNSSPRSKPMEQPFRHRNDRAMHDAMAERRRQIEHFGHTPEKDLADWRADPSKRDRLARVMHRYSCDAAESMTFGRSQHQTARLKALKAIAAGLALVDLIDALEA